LGILRGKKKAYNTDQKKLGGGKLSGGDVAKDSAPQDWRNREVGTRPCIAKHDMLRGSAPLTQAVGLFWAGKGGRLRRGAC